MRKISPKIWIPVIAFLLLAVGLAVFLAWPREGKISEVVTPEKKITSPEGIIWNVPVGDVNPETEGEIKKAVYEDRYFISLGKDLEKKGEFISVETLEIERDWVILGYAAKYKETGEFMPTEGMGILGRKINQHWEIAHFSALSANEKYCQWFQLVPDTLLSPEEKEFDKMLCE